jgi:hypothetical protein
MHLSNTRILTYTGDMKVMHFTRGLITLVVQTLVGAAQSMDAQVSVMSELAFRVVRTVVLARLISSTNDIGGQPRSNSLMGIDRSNHEAMLHDCAS